MSGLVLSCHTSIQVNSDCIVPVYHLHLEPREGGQQRGGGVGGREAEWGLIGVRVHHSLRVDPEPRPAHISLVLCENHLGQSSESGCNKRLSHLRPFESHHEGRLGHMQMSQFFLFKKIINQISTYGC